MYISHYGDKHDVHQINHGSVRCFFFIFLLVFPVREGSSEFSPTSYIFAYSSLCIQWSYWAFLMILESKSHFPNAPCTFHCCITGVVELSLSANRHEEDLHHHFTANQHEFPFPSFWQTVDWTFEGEAVPENRNGALRPSSLFFSATSLSNLDTYNWLYTLLLLKWPLKCWTEYSEVPKCGRLKV